MAKANATTTILFESNSTRSRNLGRRLKDAWTAYASNRPEFERCCREHNSRLYLSLRDNAIPKGGDLKNWFARDAEIQTDHYKAVEAADDRASSALGKVMEAVMGKSCENLGDLATLANACAIANDGLWDRPLNDLDWDQSFVRHLVEAVLAVADARNVLEGLPIPQPIEQDAFQRIAEETAARKK